MTLPRITVITPSFNQGRYLERTICSVLDQGYENLEYLVVDGGSFDGSRALLAAYTTELAAVIIEPDSGPAEAVNKALRRATGEIIAIVNSDDLLLPGALHAVATRFSRPDKPRWVVGHGLAIGEDEQMHGDLNATLPSCPAAFLMHNSGYMPSSATFYRRDVFTEFGLFDESFAYAHGYEFACRLLTAGPRPRPIGMRLAARRDHPRQLSALFAVQRAEEMIKAAQRYAGRLSMSDRYTLWMNCDVRRRIVALAKAEAAVEAPRRYLLQQIARHPWWLADHVLRHVLLNGVAATTPSPAGRRAA